MGVANLLDHPEQYWRMRKKHDRKLKKVQYINTLDRG